MTKWQPIKTAPKNKPVLLYSSMWGMTWGIVIGEFHNGVWHTSEGEAANNDPEFDPDAEADENEEFDPDANMGPTHWMPLPGPPRAADRNGST